MKPEHVDEITDVKLVPFMAQHVANTLPWVEDPELRRLFLMRGELDRDAHAAYFARVLNDDGQIWQAIVVRWKHVGNCGLKGLDRSKKECEVWIYIGDQKARGQGVGKKTTAMLLERAKAMGCRHIFLHVADFNDVAIKMYSSLGFSRSAD